MTRPTDKPAKTTKGWPPKRRAEQAARIRATRPWEKSTGPKTAEGKARSSMNAYKHGLRSSHKLLTRSLLADCARRLNTLNIMISIKEKEFYQKQALIFEKTNHIKRTKEKDTYTHISIIKALYNGGAHRL